MYCHLLLQGIFPTQGWNPGLLHWQVGFLPLSHVGSHINIRGIEKKRKHREFPVGPVVRTWQFHCRGFRLNPWSRTKIPHDTQSFQKKKKYYHQALPNSLWKGGSHRDRMSTIHRDGLRISCLYIYYWFYLFDYTRSYLQHSGSLTFDAAYGVFSHGVGTLSCGMWDRVPWQVIKPRPCIGSPES